MASTSTPALVRARAAWSPVSTLTSCSGDGPPKMTAGWLMAPLLVSVSVHSWKVVGKVILVEHPIYGSGVLRCPRDSLLPRRHAHHRGPAPAGSGQEGPGVGLTDNHHVCGDV